jgi:hypothetical protein
MGTGKSKYAMVMIREALRQGRRIATNIDVDVKALGIKKGVIIRVPDKPTIFDLEALPHGNPDTYNEERQGLLVLDELSTWMNARTFQDKGRPAVLAWFVLARKKGWDPVFICQAAMQIDRQLRESLFEVDIRCRRLDKVRIPILSNLGRLLTLGIWSGYFPRMHVANYRLLDGDLALEGKWYRADDVQSAYDTRQVFTDTYPHGTHSVLPSDYFGPPAPVSWWRRVFQRRSALPTPRPRPRHPLVATLARLPPEQRVRHARRLIELGAI